MSTLIIVLCSALGGGTLAVIIGNFQKRKLFKATEKQATARTESIAVNTLSESLETMNTQILEPLRQELTEGRKLQTKTNYELTKLRKAIEKIPSCAHAASCPVSVELQNNPNGDKRVDEE
jgi:hypothetical protein